MMGASDCAQLIGKRNVTLRSVLVRESARLRLWRVNCAAGFLPGTKATLDMRNLLQPHVLRGLRGQGRAPAAGAEEDETLVFGEDRLRIGAFRIDPEFQHAPRAGKGAGHAAFPLLLPRVAQIDENDVRGAMQVHRIGHRKCLNIRVRLGQKLLVSFGDRHVRSLPDTETTAGSPDRKHHRTG